MFWYLHFSHTAHPSERIHLVSYFCDYMIPYFKSKVVAFMATTDVVRIAILAGVAFLAVHIFLVALLIYTQLLSLALYC